MDDIIDEFQSKNNRKLFSYLSFTNAIVVSSCFVYFIFLPAQTNILFFAPVNLAKVIAILCLFGILFTILSFRRNENTAWIKWVGASINIIIFLLTIASVFYAAAINF